LTYSDELATLIDTEQVLTYSSEYEGEIRAMTVLAVELILK
jgi:hypothetical protein